MKNSDFCDGCSEWFVKLHILIMNSLLMLPWFLIWVGTPTYMLYSLGSKAVNFYSVSPILSILFMAVILLIFPPFCSNLMMVYLNWMIEINEEYWKHKLDEDKNENSDAVSKK